MENIEDPSLQEPSYFESLPTDLFIFMAKKYFTPIALYNLCTSSDVLIDKCLYQDERLLKEYLKRYQNNTFVIERYAPRLDLLRFISTTIWDEIIVPDLMITFHQNFHYNLFHFVIPDIVIYTYADNLKIHITELIELIVFHKVILWHYLPTLTFNKHYKIIKNDSTGQLGVPISFGLLLIDNSVEIIAKLSDIKYNDSVIPRYLVNGIIMLPSEKNGVESDVKVFRGKNKQKITRPFKIPTK